MMPRRKPSEVLGQLHRLGETSRSLRSVRQRLPWRRQGPVRSFASAPGHSPARPPDQGRPSRGLRYSSNSIPGPAGARRPVMCSLAPSTLLRCSCSVPKFMSHRQRGSRERRDRTPGSLWFPSPRSRCGRFPEQPIAGACHRAVPCPTGTAGARADDHPDPEMRRPDAGGVGDGAGWLWSGQACCPSVTAGERTRCPCR